MNIVKQTEQHYNVVFNSNNKCRIIVNDYTQLSILCHPDFHKYNLNSVEVAIIRLDNNIEDLYQIEDTNCFACNSLEEVNKYFNIASSLNKPTHCFYIFDMCDKRPAAWHPRYLVELDTEDYKYKFKYLKNIYSKDCIKLEEI